jgi:hypothetical protein
VIVPEISQLRRWSTTMIVLRVLMLVAGAGALAGGGSGIALVPVGLGALGLIAALVEPGGLGPGVLIGGAAGAWLLRYGGGPAPITGTVLVALALAVHHQAAALAAALPPDAKVQRAVLMRFARHGVLVLLLTAVIGGLALGAARPGGSVPLEVLGVVAALVAIAVPVLLSRSFADRGGSR